MTDAFFSAAGSAFLSGWAGAATGAEVLAGDGSFGAAAGASLATSWAGASASVAATGAGATLSAVLADALAVVVLDAAAVVEEQTSEIHNLFSSCLFLTFGRSCLFGTFLGRHFF